jgi:hypothetical protein
LEGSKFKFRWLIPIWIVTIFFLKNLIDPIVIIYPFLVGMFGGFLLDIIGHRLNLWQYPRQPFLSRDYFLLVIPAWGVFGSQINVIWNLARKYFITCEWVQAVTLTTFIVHFPLYSLYELPNLYRKSWKYSVSMCRVILGWVPLILYFRTLYKIFYLIFSAL